MKISNVRRGADPEMFLVAADGTPVSSIGLIGGSKEEPRPFGDGFAVQEDNVAVEFNIPPSEDKEVFVANIHYALDYLEKEIAEKGLNLAIVPSMDFEVRSLRHPKARHMGCDPDFNAWTLEMNPRPVAPKTLRSAGGHLHLSWDKPSGRVAEELIRVHDLFCSCPAIEIDPDSRRRSIYGKAGAFRYKPYGVEYRTPSNFWIKTKELTAWFFEQSEKAVAFINNGGEIAKEDYESIQQCINTGDASLLKALNAKYQMV